ncbi:hypothetical protein M430DRAFT_229998 [Amorphotheca resinae ATCC 22711]|uniref:Uncharacterized protein n=1 Tax=Amorphotheca resinae ATCC 22711 TaxID=857342 RepID=A0A2T3B3D0_AMORE|nr:hypothetical protein M430DRAFT_229998 [Amorphotheca resinae ATCC 22711]PSS20152.1 hypothetical protein M430DRAFT_229998 [Amorphotheca resinae ATCC 22711]
MQHGRYDGSDLTLTVFTNFDCGLHTAFDRSSEDRRSCRHLIAYSFSRARQPEIMGMAFPFILLLYMLMLFERSLGTPLSPKSLCSRQVIASRRNAFFSIIHLHACCALSD